MERRHLLMNKRTHITDLEFATILQDNLSTEDTTVFFEHIASCNYCSERFASAVAGDLMIAPKDMKANLLKAVRKPEVQLERKARETARRVKLFLYSLKVGAATVFALALIIVTLDFSKSSENTAPTYETKTSNIENENTDLSFTTVIKNQMDTLTQNMLNFSNKIMNTEVNLDDQEKK
jgi:hypothetical protein